MSARLLVATLVAILVTGCASTRELDTCAGPDWYAVGLADGRAGRAAERIAEHRRACAKAGIEPDELRYLQGRRDGLAAYCSPDNAFRDGLAGHDYVGGCDSTFARNHRAALRVAELRKEVEANRSAIAWRTAEINGNSASDARRSNLRTEVRDLEQKRDALRLQLQRAEHELQRLRLGTPYS